MLILSRREGDAILIEGGIRIVVLAVDRRGVRLGRGAGHYDRSLEFATPTSLLVAVVRDEEVVPELPVFPHDVRVDGVLTPSGGVQFLR